MSSSPPTDTDIVSLAALHLAATVGPDHWHRTRPQPIHLTIHLHLSSSYLNTPGQSDNVTDSLHYGHLAQTVQTRVSERQEKEAGYASPRALIQDVTNAAFEFVRHVVPVSGAHSQSKRDMVMGEVIHAVRVVLELPKQILLARGFEIELYTHASDWSSRSAGGSGSGSGSTAGAIVRVKNLVLPVLIGVNPPERLAKQHVITYLTFFESARNNTNTKVQVGNPKEIDYPSIVQQIATDIENSSHLTLEKLVYETIRTAYRAFDSHPNSNSNTSRIDAIAVRCQKPSALSFADASEVEMTRTWEALGLVGR